MSTQVTSHLDPTPCLVSIANTNTPYRLHVHERIAREISDLKLSTLFTHETGSAPWQLTGTSETTPILFGAGHASVDQSKLRFLWREWRKAGRIIRWMKGRNVRAILLVGYNDIGRVRLIRWAHRHQIPCMVWGDSNIRGDRATGVKKWLKKMCLPHILSRCAAILACGGLGRAYFLKYGARPHRIFLFPVEPDYKIIDSLDEAEIELVRARYALKKGRRRLIYSGRMVSEKRVDLALAAFAAIADERPEWDLMLVGGGELLDALKGLVPTHLEHRVLFTSFINDQRTVAALYRLSDALILPSDYEPWALVINEAAAAGLAIVASSVVGAAAELVREGINGRTFAAGSLPALTEALREVTAPDAIDRMKSESRFVLADWRRKADPIDGLRQALQHFGAIQRSQ